MKNMSFIFLGILSTIIIIIGFFFLVLMLFGKGDDDDVTEYLGEEHLYFLSEPTLEFTGKSQHFSFSTGKLVVGAETRDDTTCNYLLVDDFLQNKKIDNLSSLSLIRYIGEDKEIIFEESKPKNKLNKKISKFGFFNSSIVSSPSWQFEKDFFSEITEENFRENFKLQILYCTKSDECFEEDFDIVYK